MLSLKSGIENHIINVSDYQGQTKSDMVELRNVIVSKFSELHTSITFCQESQSRIEKEWHWWNSSKLLLALLGVIAVFQVVSVVLLFLGR